MTKREKREGIEKAQIVNIGDEQGHIATKLTNTAETIGKNTNQHEGKHK